MMSIPEILFFGAIYTKVGFYQMYNFCLAIELEQLKKKLSVSQAYHY